MFCRNPEFDPRLPRCANGKGLFEVGKLRERLKEARLRQHLDALGYKS